eukprot:g2925.t1
MGVRDALALACTSRAWGAPRERAAALVLAALRGLARGYRGHGGLQRVLCDWSEHICGLQDTAARAPRRTDASARAQHRSFAEAACAAQALCSAVHERQRIAAGRTHSAIASSDRFDHALFCCGVGGRGQLCDGRRLNSVRPRRALLAVSHGRARQVACAPLFTLVLVGDGDVLTSAPDGARAAGHGQPGSAQCRVGLRPLPALCGRRVALLAAGAVHCAALTADGAAWSWGREGPWLGRGCCGSGGGFCTSAACRSRGGQGLALMFLSAAAQPVSGCVDLAAGTEHTVVVTAGGGALSCGTGRFGKLGAGPGPGPAAGAHAQDAVCRLRQCSARPSGLQGWHTLQAAAGACHTLLLCARVPPASALAPRVPMEVFCTGHGRAGQLGLGSWSGRRTPVPLGLRARGVCVVQVAAGGAHSLALTA